MTTTATLGIFATSKLRRVRREEVVKPAIKKPDPYPLLMAFWVDYMHSNDRDLGVGGMKLATDAEPDTNVHDAQRKDDMRMGEAVNACVDSLAVLQRAAIYRSQGLATAWRVGASNYETVLLAAREELEEKLKKILQREFIFRKIRPLGDFARPEKSKARH